MAETVNDFEITILKPGDAIKLEPGMIHVVFSLTNSAGGRWEYVDAKWFDSRVREKGEMSSGPDWDYILRVFFWIVKRLFYNQFLFNPSEKILSFYYVYQVLLFKYYMD